MALSSKQQFLITVVVDGISIGVFDTHSGGDSQAKGNKHRPGGMGDEVSYASLPSYSDLKVTRVYERNRDHELIRTLSAKSGLKPASMTEQPLDADGNAWGKPTVYTGRFLGLSRGDTDSTFELDIEVTSIA
jgi:hypothetical protein